MSILKTKTNDGFYPVNEALLNVITPMGLEIKKNSLVIGENTGKVYGVIRYPQKVDYGWLSKSQIYRQLLLRLVLSLLITERL